MAFSYLILYLSTAALFLYAASTIREHLKVHWRLFCSILVVSLVLAKAIFLGLAGSSIAEDLVAPSVLLPGAQSVKSPILIGERQRKQLCSLSENGCATHEDFVLSRALGLNWEFWYGADGTREEKVRWLDRNDLIPGHTALDRGTYVHHFSVAMHPFRELLDGRLGALVTAQYGAISILPMFALYDKPFNWYGVSGTLLLSGVMFFFITRIRKDDRDLLHFTVPLLIAFVIALDLNEGAIRLNPGFAFYRFMPIITLLWLFIHGSALARPWLYSLSCLALILNSVQLNILFFIITAAHLILSSSWKPFSLLRDLGKLDRHMVLISAMTAIVAVFQILTYYADKSVFAASLFGSVEQDRGNLRYAGSFLILPFSLLLISWLSGRIKSTSPAERFSYVSYGCLSLYALSFPGSPQHYCGFLTSAAYPIYIMTTQALGGIPNRAVTIVLAVTLIMGQSLIFSFFSLPRVLPKDTSGLYDQKLFGGPLKFQLGTDMHELSTQFDELLSANKALPAQTYFISKDKIYFELATNKNRLPTSYDAFANSGGIKIPELQNEVEKKKIKFFVFDSQEHVNNMKRLLDLRFEQFEARKYIELIDKIELIRNWPRLERVECTFRYCLYQIMPAS